MQTFCCQKVRLYPIVVSGFVGALQLVQEAARRLVSFCHVMLILTGKS